MAVPLTEPNENWQLAQSNKLPRKSNARSERSRDMKWIRAFNFPYKPAKKNLYIPNVLLPWLVNILLHNDGLFYENDCSERLFGTTL